MVKEWEKNDFHQVLNIPARDELSFFSSTLRQILSFKAMAPEKNELDELGDAYEALCPNEKNEFIAMVTALRRKSGLSEPPSLAELNIYGLFRPLLMDTRMRGAVMIPPEWTPDSVALTFDSGKGDIGDPRQWRIYLHDGISYYLGQDNALFAALVSYAQHLFADKAAVEQAALYLWDEIGMLAYSEDYGGIIDGLKLAAYLPSDHYRVERILSDYNLLSSQSAGIRLAAAKLAECHRPQGCINSLKDLLIAETAGLAWEAQIRALRAIGGEDSFNALLEAAQNSTNSKAAQLASRALAWVMNYPERAGRLVKLCASRDFRLSVIGSKAFAESRHHSVFSYGGDLATDGENALRAAFYDLMEKRASEDQMVQLRNAFASHRVNILTGEAAVRAGVGEDGAVVATSDGIVVLMLRKEHIDQARDTLAHVCQPEMLVLPK
ncbi:MAG: hypothetical protein KJ717_09050 [Proteobacteria bacterium]|nr:hypothetical protein [Pseudomonadota bacterium]